MFNSALEILAAITIAFLAGTLYGRSRNTNSSGPVRFEVVPS